MVSIFYKCYNDRKIYHDNCATLRTCLIFICNLICEHAQLCRFVSLTEHKKHLSKGNVIHWSFWAISSVINLNNIMLTELRLLHRDCAYFTSTIYCWRNKLPLLFYQRHTMILMWLNENFLILYTRRKHSIEQTCAHGFRVTLLRRALKLSSYFC